MKYLLLVLGMLAALPGQAYSWKHITPGKSTRQDVLTAFGEPAKVTTVSDREILVYLGTRGIAGTRQTHFRVDTSTLIVDRIDVFPSSKISKALVVATYGPPCAETPEKGKACYVEKISGDTRVYYLYPRLGLAVFFQKDGNTVFNFVYVPTERAPRTETATSPPSGEDEEESPGEPDARDAVFGEVGDTQSGSGEDENAAALTTSESLMDDPLKIGGLFYLRSVTELGSTRPVGEPQQLAVATGAPMLLDLYLDGRPNERLRAMVLGRLLYEPMRSVTDPANLNPSVTLDQLWVNFDIAKRVFVTAGRQRVKWGSGRLWNPTDFLTPPRLNPLAPFDERIGTDMVKLNVPLPDLATNLYVLGLVNTRGPEKQPLQFGTALRGEVVVLGAEVSGTAVFIQGRGPRYGIDLSTAVGPVDLHAEVGLRRTPDLPMWREASGASATTDYTARYERYIPDYFQLSGTAGITWVHQFNEKRTLSLAVEGYHNPLGYSDPAILPWLIAQGSYQPFYAGQWYAAALATYSYQDFLDAFNVTGALLGNLSDQTYLARVDLSLRVLKDMFIELFVSVPLGHGGGEFRLGWDEGLVPGLGGRPVPMGQLGLGLRFAI
ncbi:MAG: hypothetical protein M3Y59_20460 [Myxococcota bacterium]|nr:hypothetical protein [Myxococcota bacterium]